MLLKRLQVLAFWYTPEIAKLMSIKMSEENGVTLRHEWGELFILVREDDHTKK